MTKVIFLAVTISLAACADTSSTLTIDNDSSYTLTEINLSPVDQISWGTDLLGPNVLAPGEAFQVSNISCNTYDIRLVDDTNDECILADVALCLDNAVWLITNTELAACAF